MSFAEMKSVFEYEQSRFTTIIMSAAEAEAETGTTWPKKTKN